jgi:hypothetical protein
MLPTKMEQPRLALIITDTSGYAKHLPILECPIVHRSNASAYLVKTLKRVRTLLPGAADEEVADYLSRQ